MGISGNWRTVVRNFAVRVRLEEVEGRDANFGA